MSTKVLGLQRIRNAWKGYVVVGEDCLPFLIPHSDGYVMIREEKAWRKIGVQLHASRYYTASGLRKRVMKVAEEFV